MQLIKHSFILWLPFLFCACSNSKGNKSDGGTFNMNYKSKDVVVGTQKVYKGSFSIELMSNGKLIAQVRATVPFLLNENIKEIRVKNGQRVNEGDVLAVQEQFSYKQDMERSRLGLESARLELSNMLLGAGYSMEDTLAIPEKQWTIYKIKSGFSNALLTRREAVRKYESTFIKAPVSGLVSGLEAKAFNPSSVYKYFCTLINTTKMEVVFKVLETEAATLALGQIVEVFPYAQLNHKTMGNVVEISPAVDENSMVAVKAIVTNSDGSLLDGMNVKIRVKNAVLRQLIIPKKSVVIRQGKHVVFAVHDNLAIWKYVTIGLENSLEYTILDGLKEGDEIITENNINLAHQVPIVVKNGR